MYCHPGTKSLLFSKWLSILVSKFRKFLFNADASIRWTSKEHTMSMAAFVGYNYKKKGSLHINQRLYFDVVHWPSPYILGHERPRVNKLANYSTVGRVQSSTNLRTLKYGTVLLESTCLPTSFYLVLRSLCSRIIVAPSGEISFAQLCFGLLFFS